MTDSHDAMHDQDAHEAHHHIVPISIYLAIFGTLMVMTALTVWVAFHDWGEFNIIIALGIAVFKASLVVLFFMHVRYASKLTQLASVTGFIWLAIFIGFTLSDYGTRQWVGWSDGWAMQPSDEGMLGVHEAAAGGHGEAGEEAAGEH